MEKIKKIVIIFFFIFGIFLENSIVFAQSFPDINDEYKYAKAIDFIAQNNIVNGYPDGTYKSRNILNRAELLKIILEAFYAKENFIGYENKRCFNDVPANNWYTSYVCFAKEKGFVNGYADGNFKPDGEIKLVEALKISLEVFGYKYAQSLPWYKGIIDKASWDNFIPSDFTRFDQLVNRGQIADLITRMIKYQIGDQGEYLNDLINNVVTYDSLFQNLNVNFNPLNDAGSIPPEVMLDVSFTSQAPYGQWIPPYNEACEEAALIMVEYYLRSMPLTQETAKNEILNMVKWEDDRKFIIDISVNQMGDIATHYYSRNAQVYFDNSITINNMKKLLAMGHPIIIPVSGGLLHNPNYSAPYHVIVLIGYDSKNFYAHDPGTYRGAKYAYPQTTILNAIHDWAGSKSNVLEGRKAMLVIN